MRTIAAIPTTYKGIQFRSRLEARWAICFDVLGIEWHYEFEGYQMEDCWYVPDFWLPKVGPVRVCHHAGTEPGGAFENLVRDEIWETQHDAAIEAARTRRFH